MRMPRLAAGVDRFPLGAQSATSGLRPAFKVACACTGTGKHLSCNCAWESGGCWGDSTSSADGSWETHSGCGGANPWQHTPL